MEIKGISGLAKYLGISRATLNIWQKRGLLPKPDRETVTDCGVYRYWNQETVDAWKPRKVVTVTGVAQYIFKFKSV